MPLGNERMELFLLGLTLNRLCKDFPVLPAIQAMEEKGLSHKNFEYDFAVAKKIDH